MSSVLYISLCKKNLTEGTSSLYFYYSLSLDLTLLVNEYFF